MDNAQPGMSLSFNARGAQPQQRVAMRIVVLGDFSGGSGAAQAEPVYVNKDNVNETLEACGATLHLEVENFLQDVRTPLNVAMRVTNLTDLSPAGVVAHIPDLTVIFLFRQRVQMLLRREISTAEFTQGLSAYDTCAALSPALRRCRAALAANSPPPPKKATPAPTERDEDEIARILDLVASPNQPTTPAKPGLDAVFHSIGTARTFGGAPPEISQELNLLTALLDRQITAILHHPLFQRMEAAWRGVKLLLDHTGREDVKIELVDTRRDQLAETFHTRVFDAENSGIHAAPLGLALLDFEFDSTSHDVALLHSLAQDAEALQAPLVFSVRPDFFGTPPEDVTQPLPFLGTRLDEPRYHAWNALRAKECARWLCAAYNPLLLRAVHTPENTHGLEYTETSTERASYLWGHPGWMLAVLVARSMTGTQWPTQITGMQHGQLTGLDLWTYRDRSGQETAIPLQRLLSRENADDLAQFGFASLTCQPNRDAAYLLHAPVLRIPGSYPGHATPAAQDLTSLPYQLLAGRVTTLLGAQRDLFGQGGDTNQVAANAQKFLDGMLAGTGPGAHSMVSVHPDPARPGHHLLDLELHIGRDILNGATLHLTVPV